MPATTAEQTAANRLEELTRRKVELEGRFSDTRDRKIELREMAAEKIANGGSPNGERAKIRDLDSDLDLLAGALERIDQDIQTATTEARAENVAGIVAGAESMRVEARKVASSASDALRELVERARELEGLSSEYRLEIQRAKAIAKGAGVPEPRVSDDLLAGAFPASPDRWGIGYHWTSKVHPILSDLQQVITALDAAEHWNTSRSQESTE